MTRREIVVLLIGVAAAACGQLSPATPSALEKEVRLQVSPVRPLRVSASSVLYILDYSVFNPRVATEAVTVTRVEFTLLGPDGLVYSTAEDPQFTFGRAATLRPGEGRTGNAVVTDPNVTRPIAIKYTARMLFTRTDGSTWSMEDNAAIIP